MRILAIDYGTKNIGLAISNREETLALPYKTIPLNQALLKDLKSIIKEEGIDTVIVGVPQYKTETRFFKSTQIFIQKLRARILIPIVPFDELLSSEDARKRLPNDKSRQHEVAAMLILEQYLAVLNHRNKNFSS